MCVVADRGMVSEASWSLQSITSWDRACAALRRSAKSCFKPCALTGTHRRAPGLQRLCAARGQGSRSRVTPLHRLPQRRGAARGCSQPRRHPRLPAEQLRRGDKSLVKNKGYRRVPQDRGWRPLRYRRQSGRLGKTLRRSLRVAHRHRSRRGNYRPGLQNALDGRGHLPHGKSILETRPIFHKSDETIRGHLFCSFLALCLKRELEICTAEKRPQAEWPRSCAAWTTPTSRASS